MLWFALCAIPQSAISFSEPLAHCCNSPSRKHRLKEHEHHCDVSPPKGERPVRMMFAEHQDDCPDVPSECSNVRRRIPMTDRFAPLPMIAHTGSSSTFFSSSSH